MMTNVFFSTVNISMIMFLLLITGLVIIRKILQFAISNLVVNFNKKGPIKESLRADAEFYVNDPMKVDFSASFMSKNDNGISKEDLIKEKNM